MANKDHFQALHEKRLCLLQRGIARPGKQFKEHLPLSSSLVPFLSIWWQQTEARSYSLRWGVGNSWTAAAVALHPVSLWAPLAQHYCLCEHMAVDGQGVGELRLAGNMLQALLANLGVCGGRSHSFLCVRIWRHPSRKCLLTSEPWQHQPKELVPLLEAKFPSLHPKMLQVA